MTVIKGFEKKMVATAVSIYVVFLGYALVAFTPLGLFWFMALGSLIMALCLPVANVSLQTITQTVVPLKMQGRVNSVTMALASAATPLGMILSGVIVGFIKTANFFFICSGLGVIVLTLAWLLTDVRHVDKNEKSNNQTDTQLS
jgi:MFS family permease